MRDTTENIVKILPKGLVTIPKKLRQELGFEESGLARVKKEGRRLVLEPVSVIGYPLRDYTKEEVREFVNQDRLPPKLKKKLKNEIR